jgi:ribosome-binding factor A
MIRRVTTKKGNSRVAEAVSDHRKPTIDQGLQEVVAEVREGDGFNPRDEAKRKLQERRTRPAGHERGAHRKEQFAAQVKETIDAALRLAAEPLLNTLTVKEIVQQGGSLLVVAEPRDPEVSLDVSAATRALKKAAPMLTREVAREITRKETPMLSFVVLPAGAERMET